MGVHVTCVVDKWGILYIDSLSYDDTSHNRVAVHFTGLFGKWGAYTLLFDKPSVHLGGRTCN